MDNIERIVRFVKMKKIKNIIFEFKAAINWEVLNYSC